MPLFNLSVAAVPTKRTRSKVGVALSEGQPASFGLPPATLALYNAPPAALKLYLVCPPKMQPCPFTPPHTHPSNNQAGPALATAAARGGGTTAAAPASRWGALVGVPRTIRSRLLARTAQ